MVIEIGQITPPIGIIPFVLHGMAPDVPLKTIFSGIAPFFVADLARLAIVAIFPALSLWLPRNTGIDGLMPAIGRPFRRKEDRRLLTGRGRFSDDVNLPGQAYAAMARSPHAHAPHPEH